MRYKVVVETSIVDGPRTHELRAALIVANQYFKGDVTFIRRKTYATPDIESAGVSWEIKSPLGNGKKTIENNLRAARKQSRYLIMDFSRMKLHQAKAIANIKFYLKKSPRQFKRLLVITKTNEVIEIL